MLFMQKSGFSARLGQRPRVLRGVERHDDRARAAGGREASWMLLDWHRLLDGNRVEARYINSVLAAACEHAASAPSAQNWLRGRHVAFTHWHAMLQGVYHAEMFEAFLGLKAK